MAKLPCVGPREATCTFGRNLTNSSMVLTFVHTMGEFGVVLMIGGSIPGETKTLAIAIYDRVQAFDLASADRMAALLLVLSLSAVAASFFASARLAVRR